MNEAGWVEELQLEHICSRHKSINFIIIVILLWFHSGVSSRDGWKMHAEDVVADDNGSERKIGFGRGDSGYRNLSVSECANFALELCVVSNQSRDISN